MNRLFEEVDRALAASLGLNEAAGTVAKTISEAMNRSEEEFNDEARRVWKEFQREYKKFEKIMRGKQLFASEVAGSARKINQLMNRLVDEAENVSPFDDDDLDFRMF